MDYASAFKKPFTNFKNLIIGILISIVPIVNFFATGYMLEIAKNEMKKNKKFIAWANWGNLFVKGLLAFLIGIIYAIPVIIIVIIAGWSTIMANVGASFQNQVFQPSTELLANLGSGLVFALLVGLLIAFIAPCAILHFVAEGKFKSAFKLGSIFKKAFSKKYAAAWAVAMLYSVALSYVLQILLIVGSAAASFISGVTMFSLLGEIYPEL